MNGLTPSNSGVGKEVKMLKYKEKKRTKYEGMKIPRRNRDGR
jgi:hypothetical protein